MRKENKRRHGGKDGRQALKKSRDRQFGDRRASSNKKYPVVQGTVSMTREGYAFVEVPEEPDNDVFVKASKTRGALNGDIVKVAVTREKPAGKGRDPQSKRREGEVVEIVERSKKPFVGILHTIGAQAWVLMQSRVMPYDIKVDFATLPKEAKKGMKVAVVIDKWDRGETNPSGHIVDVLGEPGANDTEMHAILAEYGLPYRFEPEVEKAAEAISDKITEKDLQGRRDFRDTLTFTIDPADAKDFDDAISFKKLSDGNYEIGVHIADVSYYVRPGSILDKEAQERGTSVYLVDRTVPMLPEKLSNRMCSLRPNEDKLTFSAVFELTPKAEVVSRWFGRTVIRSDYRFAYETAQQIIDNGRESMNMELRGGTDGKTVPVADPVLDHTPEAAARMEEEERKAAARGEAAMGQGIYEGCVIPLEIKEAILDLWSVAAILRKRRFDSGAISFERPEMKVVVDAAGRPVDVHEV
ncbi:MAG: RNB domain-containing ribonuclease, partial [Bacteroidales bacterium]|nr:RNB domain-containing ribonuclease [Bacteroidales bacterium]